MDHARAVRYRKLALQEPDQETSHLLQLIADETERGVLVTSECLARRQAFSETSQPRDPMKDSTR
jgi:hypothetical protein